MDDELFLALAEKAGFPLEPQLRRCEELQAVERGRGEDPSLFDLARRQGLVTEEQALRLLSLGGFVPGPPRGAPPPGLASELAPPLGLPETREKRSSSRSSRTSSRRKRRVRARIEDSAERVISIARGRHSDEQPLSTTEQRLRATAGVLSLVALAVLLALAGALVARKPAAPPPPVAPPPEPPARPVTVNVSDSPAPGATGAGAPASGDNAAPVASIASDPGLEPSGIATRATLDGAVDLARAGRECAAVERLDEALASNVSPSERAALEATRQGILDQVSRRMDQDFAAAEKAARAGDTATVSSIVDGLYAHVPAALGEKRRAGYERLAAIAATSPGPPPPDARPLDADSERASVLAARLEIDRALVALDAPLASASVVLGARNPDAALEARNDAARVQAVAALLGWARDGFERETSHEVTLELRKGNTLKATLRKVGPDRLLLHVPFKGDQEVKLCELSLPALFEAARRGAGDRQEECAFGAGVLLACSGDIEGALLELGRARDLPQAALLRLRIEKEAAARPRDPAAKSSLVERQRRLEERAAGRFQVALASRRYDVLSNGTEAQVRELAAAMDLMGDEYVKIFAPRPEPPALEIRLYKDRAEFLAQTKASPSLLGFYDGERIVAYHQDSVEKTRTTLFHEGTHQFEGLVWGKNLWSNPLWFVEGLAVYFEASRPEGDKLVTGEISKPHLAAVQRALRDLNEIPLASLLHAKQPEFGFAHYAHSWSLIYFLVNGTEGGRGRVRRYFEGLREGKDGAKLFEDLFKKPLPEIEQAWKEYVRALG